MNRQNKTKRIVMVIMISLIIIAGNINHEASAFTVYSSELTSAFSENNHKSSRAKDHFDRFLPSQDDITLVVLSQNEEYRLFQNSDQRKSFSPFDHGLTFRKKMSDLYLIQGDYCLILLEHSEQFFHFPHKRDDREWVPSPSPVPLPATALFFATGLAVLVGLTSRRLVVT